MKSYDFEYDSLKLSDFGMIICKFDSSGVDTVSNGSEITFNTVSTLNGQKHQITSAEYSDCLTATFQICKNLCSDYDMEISIEEMREIMRWLNRKEYHKFKLIDDEYTGLYFEASFNVSKIEINGKIFGFELELFTNRPFALQEDVVLMIEVETEDLNETYIKNDNTMLESVSINQIHSRSDEEGYIYPDMEISIKKDGDLEIYSITEDRTTVLRNCKANEVITIRYPMITTDNDVHKKTIMNDFNWRFFRLSSAFKNRANEVAISIPCSIKMTYSPVAKVGI